MSEPETTKEQKRELLFPGIQKEVYKTKQVKVNPDRIYEENLNLQPFDSSTKEKESAQRKVFLGDVPELVKFSNCLTLEKEVHVSQNITTQTSMNEPLNKLKFISKFFFSATPVSNTLSDHLQYNQLSASEDPQKLSEMSIRPSAKDEYKIKAFIDQNLIFLIFPHKKTIYVNRFKSTQSYKKTKFVKRFDFDCKIFNVHKLTASLFLVTSESRFYILKSDLETGFSADYKAKLNVQLPNDVRCRFKNIIQTEGFVASFNCHRIFFFQKPDLRFVQFVELKVASLQNFKIKTVEHLKNDTLLAINNVNNFIVVEKSENGKFNTVKVIYDKNLLGACCSCYDKKENILFIGTKLGKIHFYKITPDNNVNYIDTFFSKNILGNKIKEIFYDNNSKIGLFYCVDKKNGVRQFNVEEIKSEDGVRYEVKLWTVWGMNLYIRSADLNTDSKTSGARVLIGTSKGFVNIYKDK